MRRAQQQRRRLVRTGTAVALAIALAGSVAACSESGPIASPTARPSDVIGQNYQSGDGSVTTWAAADRGAPVDLKGTDFEGAAVDVSAWRGDVVVINNWYAGCPPCRAEAPGLVRLATQEAASGVRWVGINGVDDAGAAQAFQRTFQVPYPSIQDTDGRAVAALQGSVPIQAVPTTVVLDRQGRVAARVLGQADESTLKVLIDGAVAESSPGASATP